MVIAQKIQGAWRDDEIRDQTDDRETDQEIEHMAHRQQDRRARHVAVQLRERDHRARERDGADRDAQAHLDQALRFDRARFADPEGLRAVERRRRDQHGGQTDEAVERGHQLRHRGHRDAPRDARADDAADGKAGDDQSPGQRVAHACDEQRRDHGDDHADDAVAVAVARALGRRQSAQREDEQHARDEIGEGGEIGVHRAVLVTSFLFSCTSRACAA